MNVHKQVRQLKDMLYLQSHHFHKFIHYGWFHVHRITVNAVKQVFFLEIQLNVDSESQDNTAEQQSQDNTAEEQYDDLDTGISGLHQYYTYHAMYSQHGRIVHYPCLSPCLSSYALLGTICKHWRTRNVLGTVLSRPVGRGSDDKIEQAPVVSV